MRRKVPLYAVIGNLYVECGFTWEDLPEADAPVESEEGATAVLLAGEGGGSGDEGEPHQDHEDHDDPHR